MNFIMKAENLTMTFRSGEPVLRGISLEIEEGTFTVILGPSGSGKTTLLYALSGLRRPASGRVFYRDRDLWEMGEKRLAAWKRKEMGTVFQNYLLLENLTAHENILIGCPTGRAAVPLLELARKLEIEDALDRFPSQLSGGQQQRVAIARAMIKKPGVLFCDEPTGSLDESNSKKAVGLLHELKAAHGITVLLTTHNRQISKTADRVLTIRDGRMICDKRVERPIAAQDMVWE